MGMMHGSYLCPPLLMRYNLERCDCLSSTFTLVKSTTFPLVNFILLYHLPKPMLNLLFLWVKL